jgi:hypothetical protein
VCRSTQCCLAVWSIWVESSTRLGGFRALKKTTEAPYTTKVNNRERTTRGTTLAHTVVCASRYSPQCKKSKRYTVRGQSGFWSLDMGYLDFGFRKH